MVKRKKRKKEETIHTSSPLLSKLKHTTSSPLSIPITVRARYLAKLDAILVLQVPLVPMTTIHFVSISMET